MTTLRNVLIFGILIIMELSCTLALATDLDKKKEALDVIADFADRLCYKVPLSGKSQNVELSGTAKAELNSLLKKIADLGIEGAAKYQTSEYENVLQKDMATLLRDSSECKLEVFKDLKDKLLTSAKTTPIKSPYRGEETANLVVNGNFKEHWSQGWEKKLQDRTKGSLYAELIESSTNKNDKILHIKLEGQNFGWVEQTIELPKEKNIQGLQFEIETKINAQRGGGFNIGASIEAYVAIQFRDNKDALGTIRLSNSKKHQFQDMGLAGVKPGEKPTGDNCFIPIGGDYQTVRFSVEDKFYDCLSGQHKAEEVRKIVIAGVLQVNGRSDFAEIYMDNVRLFYKDMR